MLQPSARARLRGALREAPDHYELLDARLVGRLAGFLFCCAGAIAALLLALDPPTGAVGGAGWPLAGATVALAFAFGGAMVVNRRAFPPVVLFGIALSGPSMLGLLQWLSGRESSYVQLLILSVVWCATVLPARRLAAAVAAGTVVVFLPMATGDWAGEMLPERIATLGIMWSLAVVCFVHANRMRDVRRSLRAEAAEADELARVDALTGLGNRRALDEELVSRVALATRTGTPLCALVGDLDGFKQINDRFGHGVGDEILTSVAWTMKDVVRAPDSCFRWGGDEFVVLLSDVGLAAAEEVADRITTTIASRCSTPDATPVSLTLGTAEHLPGQPPSRLLAIADAALLAAKPGSRIG
ncbi:GGDEF domain-containing protein [Baekduia alba]|uniref:GGDEF domain-containing protein n=1 Tax=Baekduia alba TaxID=2997333 RepID=UPI002340124E|nr:GGDEF domain-containing protein [Baekduia alba]